MADSFEDSLKLTNNTLLLSGVRIKPSENKLWIHFINFLFYLNFIWLYTDVIAEFFWIIEGIEVGKSFVEASFIVPCATISILTTVKSTGLFYKRDILWKVFEKLRQIHPEFDEKDAGEKENDNFDDLKKYQDGSKNITAIVSKRIEQKIVKDATKFLNFVIILLYYSSFTVIVVFSMLPLMVMGYDYFQKGETDLKLPFLVKYFFNPFTKEIWPWVYIHQVWSTFVAGFNIVGADGFLFICCAFLQMHFRILCHRFEHVVTDSAVETKEKLKLLVKRHQELIEIVNEVESLYSFSTLFNIVTSSVLICLSAFNVTVLEDVGEVFAFCTFLTMSLSQISLLCVFGDMLMGSSTEISNAIYKCRWYDTDPGIKRSIFLIIIRAHKPCKLTACNFADIDLTAFTTILSRSWSYFALLRTVYK